MGEKVDGIEISLIVREEDVALLPGDGIASFAVTEDRLFFDCSNDRK